MLQRLVRGNQADVTFEHRPEKLLEQPCGHLGEEYSRQKENQNQWPCGGIRCGMSQTVLGAEQREVRVIEDEVGVHRVLSGLDDERMAFTQ